MSIPTDLDRRKAVPSNQIFEAHDPFDPTKEYFLFAYEEGEWVTLSFVEDRNETCGLHVHSSMPLSLEDCQKFGESLLAYVARQGKEMH